MSGKSQHLVKEDLIKRCGKPKYSRWRLVILGAAFLVILINPFANYYLQQNFIQGWYQSLGIGKLWFVSPLEGIESLLVGKTMYLPSLVGMVIPLFIAFFLGRVFCSWLCPVSFILEIFDRLRKTFTGKKYIGNTLVVAKKVLWFTLIAEIVLSMVLGAPIFVFLSPPGLVGREIMMLVFFKKLAFEGGLLLLIIFLELLTKRFFCRSFCPLGGLLAFVGKKRSLVVSVSDANCTECGLCERTCPMGLKPQLHEGETAYCWNCGDCLDSCHFDALHFRWQQK